MNAEQTFRAKAPGIVALLRGDFPFAPLDCFAVTGNSGHESLGFTVLQEMKPVVAGSRGGWGWMQWTGPRRRAFEAYCKRNKLDPASDKANYAWLFLELKGEERRAVDATKAASSLDDKVIAFEKAFLRAGVKHYPSRQQWARIAQSAYEAAGSPSAVTPRGDKIDMLTDEAKAREAASAQQGAGAGAAGAGGVGTVAVDQATGLGGLPVTLVILGVVAIAAVFLFHAIRNRKTADALRLAAKEV